MIFGGRGYESDISIRGANYFYALIDKEKYDVIPLFITKDGAWMRLVCDADFCPSEYVMKRKFLGEAFPAYRDGCGGLFFEGGFLLISCAIPLLHGDFGEDGRVQGLLECARIPFVGCDTAAAAVSRDKAFVKTLAHALKIPTANSAVLVGDEKFELSKTSLDFPLFVKPVSLGSSIGASKAENEKELETAIAHARKFSSRIVIERFINVKKELECAYFADKSKELFTNPGEIVYNSNFYNYEEKYGEKSTALVSPTSDVPDNISEKVKEYSKALVHTLGVRDLARIDFFLSDSGELYFNEINTFPGFTDISLYPKLLALSGVAPTHLANSLIEGAIERGA